MRVRSLHWSPPLYEPQQPDEVEILARLAMAAMGLDPLEDPAVTHDLVLETVLSQAVGRPGSRSRDRDPAELRTLLWAEHPADRVLEVMLRSGRHGDGFGSFPDGLTLEKLAANPHGIDLGALEPQLPNILTTPSQKIELAPPEIVADVARLVAAMDEPVPEMLLIGRRDLRSNNSWMHNVEVLVKGRERCTLQVNPADVDRFGLSADGDAKISSRVGTLVAPVEVTPGIAPGVVSLPHGWGHDAPGTRMTVASAHAGVNSNVLTDPDRIDPLSGNATLNAIPLTIGPA